MPRLKLVDIYESSTFTIIKDMLADTRFADIKGALGESDISDTLDIDYIYDRSGLKPVSFMMYRLLGIRVVDDDMYYSVIYNRRRTGYEYTVWTGKVAEAEKTLINIMYYKFYKKWKKLADTVIAIYSALEPYNMKLESEYSDNQERENIGYSNGSSKTNNNVKNSTNNSRWGFNTTDDPVPTDKSVDEGSNNSDTTNASHNSSTGTSTRTGENKVTRKGNIGNKSAAQLLEEERENARFLLVEAIYSDLDSLLAAEHY